MSKIRFYSQKEQDELKSLIHLRGKQLNSKLKEFCINNKRSINGAMFKVCTLRRESGKIVEKPVVVKKDIFNFVMGKNQIEIPIKSVEISNNKLIVKY